MQEASQLTVNFRSIVLLALEQLWCGVWRRSTVSIHFVTCECVTTRAKHVNGNDNRESLQGDMHTTEQGHTFDEHVGEAKINDFNVKLVIEQEILSLQIAVNDVLAVEILNS